MLKTIILAAGKGTRMRSSKAKVLHKIADKPLLHHVYDTCQQLENNSVLIVYGYEGEQIKRESQQLATEWIEQKEQLGTGHAVQQAEKYIDKHDTVLILYADVPLLKKSTIVKLLKNVTENSMGLLTVELDNPKGYGRIVRTNNGAVLKIIEEKDATEAEKLITEGNTGIMACPGNLLKQCLAKLKNNNAQREYYLTDLVEIAVKQGLQVKTNLAESQDEVLGVNDCIQLAHLERVYQLAQAKLLMRQGVNLRDPTRIDVRGQFSQLGQDIKIDINVLFEGVNTLGNHVSIGANSCIKNATIGNNVEILANCMIEDAIIADNCRIGPYARLRPQTELASHVQIGNFVEIKKSTIASASKINHLSYIGDAVVGSQVNIGAGTITCNYDGVNKSTTVIKDEVFIGSDTQLIAPVTVGKGATIGAGSTITKDVPEDQLTLSRSKQLSVANWKKPSKQP